MSRLVHDHDDDHDAREHAWIGGVQAQRRRRLMAGVAVTVVALVAALVPVAGPVASEPGALTIRAVRDTAFEARPGGPLFVLFIGTDARAGFDGERGDALHLVGIDPGKRQATILNIPRDTYVDIPGHGRHKLTLAYLLGGDDLTVQTVSHLVGVPISYAVSTDFAGFKGLVDDMGGIDVHVPFAMDDRNSGAVFSEGPMHMTGSQALAFARNRAVPDGDIRRSEHQGWMLLSALAKAKAESTSPASTLRLIGIMARRTRMQGGSWTDVYRLARLALSLDIGAVRNVTMPSRIGFAGREAVVFPAPAAGSLFQDFRDDGVLQSH